MTGFTLEEKARVQAVRYDSPAIERAGAMLLGCYMPLTYIEAMELDALARQILEEKRITTKDQLQDALLR